MGGTRHSCLGSKYKCLTCVARRHTGEGVSNTKCENTTGELTITSGLRTLLTSILHTKFVRDVSFTTYINSSGSILHDSFYIYNSMLAVNQHPLQADRKGMPCLLHQMYVVRHLCIVIETRALKKVVFNKQRENWSSILYTRVQRCFWRRNLVSKTVRPTPVPDERSSPMPKGLSPPQTSPQRSEKLLNKQMHAENGNRQHLGINACTWNCNRGLLDHLSLATPKLAEIQNLMLTHNIDIMALNEAGIHGKRSQIVRATPMTTISINRELAVPGYKIILPDSWTQHDTARIMVYVRDDITTMLLTTQTSSADLPVITFTAWKGAEAPTANSFFYREFTDGISRLKTQD